MNATPEVQAEALPYLRIMFAVSFGMLLFFMLGGALRSAGDARTPLRLGLALTRAQRRSNVLLIRGSGRFRRSGTTGAAMGAVIAGAIVGEWSASGPAVLGAARRRGSRAWSGGPTGAIIRALFRFGLPTGLQGSP